MLYLEDYLEMIEHLPQELRDRFTEMRELDLSVQNNMDEIEKRVRVFFSDCKKYQNELPPTTDPEFQAIRKEYYKVLEDADEKVQLANQMYDLVDKYLRRLDTELHKFKCELEADNKGITELLEKRSLELDTQSPSPNITSQFSQQKENRYERYTRPRSEKRRDSSATLQTSFSEKRQATAATVTLPLIETRHVPVTQIPSNSTTNVNYPQGYLGPSPGIAAAATQAITATHQMQQGRRSASLKASYDAVNSGQHGTDYGINRELPGAAHPPVIPTTIQQDHQIITKKKQNKKWANNSGSSANNSGVTTAVQSILNATSVVNSAPASPVAEAAASAENADGDWTYDPNEPRYCVCNQVSYGDMVACDNEDCPSEWFHYPCVGITAPPKGKWYCPQCTASMRRRGGRKN